jgi:hypothetical protein
LLSTSYRRHVAPCNDTKRPQYATSTDTPTDTYNRCLFSSGEGSIASL